MQIARSQNEKSVGDIVARVYGIKPDDPRAAAAQKALLAANPHLQDPAKLPAGTPLVVPDIAGLQTSAAASDPQQALWTGLLDRLFDSAQQGALAQATGQPTSTDKSARPRSQALTKLQNDIAQFKKLHIG
jgi:phage tail protein X